MEEGCSNKYDSARRSIRRNNARARCYGRALLGAFLSLSVVLWAQRGAELSGTHLKSSKGKFIKSESHVPKELVKLGLYNPAKDFVNEIGISPPYWKPQKLDRSGYTWGPCYPPAEALKNDLIVEWIDDRINSDFEYSHNPYDRAWKGTGKVAGGCRPGFLIIGAGKCGTSSLYHYLLGHPRVAPAFEKQIHYFVYHLSKPLDWYYSWFPTATSFLEHGALVTGEASPGYLPYPKVVKATSDLLPGKPKIIMVGRNPLERMYSSYRYNYITPTLQKYKEGRKSGIRSHQNDSYYDPYFFSFEELVKAELKQLKKCLYGFGPKETRRIWYQQKWTRAEFSRRSRYNLDPLIDLDEVCYGKSVNTTVVREQWAELQMAHPERLIPRNKAFLIQSFIGRSLYALPLEWWYIQFKPENILFYCTEDLSDPNKLNQLSMSLGLPTFNYTDIVNQGAFNVGSHQGYDTATPWDELEKEEKLDSHHSDGTFVYNDDMPLSPEVRKEVLDFIQPFNERLFRLTGVRCNW